MRLQQKGGDRRRIYRVSFAVYSIYLSTSVRLYRFIHNIYSIPLAKFQVTWMCSFLPADLLVCSEVLTPSKGMGWMVVLDALAGYFFPPTSLY